MSNNNNFILKKSQSQMIIFEDQKFEEKLKKSIERKSEPQDNRSQEKTISTLNTLSDGLSEFQLENTKSEYLGSYNEQRSNILFGRIDVNEDQDFIFQFLLFSQKCINKLYTKMTSGMSFFFDTPKKAEQFALNLKENIANFGLIIHLYLINNNKEKAFEIYLLMCKQNEKLIEFVYKKLYTYCDKSAPAMVRCIPKISQSLIHILSCLIKLSGIFSKTNFQNLYGILYIKTIYVLTLIDNKNNKIIYKNDLLTHRLYVYSSCLFDWSIFCFYRYQSLKYSIYILQHIIKLYKEKDFKDYTHYEQILLLKVNYNLGLFFYVDKLYNQAIYSSMQAKKILYEMVLSNYKLEEREILNEIGRNSAILESKEKNLLSGLTFYKEKIKNIDDKNVNKNISINKFINKGPKYINDDSNKELPRKQASARNPTSLFLGIRQFGQNQPILFDHIKRKIIYEIEMLLAQIELKKKNFRGALEHIYIILNKEKARDDLEPDSQSKKNSFYMINKTYKNLKSCQAIKVKKFKYFKNDEKKINSSQDNNSNFDETIQTENDIIMINKLLDKIDQEYNEYLQNERTNNLFRRHKYFNLTSSEIKNINYTNFKEMEKFFIFICGLSILQLKILNESQPKISLKRNDLPIIFTNQFQDCLTNAQRLDLAQLETMSLSRYIILIDSNKDISPENLDYKYMKYRVKSSNNDYEDDDKFKYIVEDKFNHKSVDNGICTISKNFNNTVNKKRKIVKIFEYEDENKSFDILLTKIKNEDNNKFIESHKKSIIKTFNSLNKDDKELFQKSPNKLKEMLKNIEIKMKKNQKKRQNYFRNDTGTKTENFSFS